jgi:hypothetical protein
MSFDYTLKIENGSWVLSDNLLGIYFLCNYLGVNDKIIENMREIMRKEQPSDSLTDDKSSSSEKSRDNSTTTNENYELIEKGIMKCRQVKGYNTPRKQKYPFLFLN